MAILKFRGIYLEDFEQLEVKDPNTRYIVLNPDGSVYGEYIGDKLIGIRPIDFEPRIEDLELEAARLDAEVIRVEQKVDAKDILIGTARVYTTTLPLSGLRTIDGITLEENDKVLVAGNGELNGIYIVEVGDWVRELEVEAYQVVSIDEGNVYGGSMQKKRSNGTTQTVKKPERARWKTISHI